MVFTSLLLMVNVGPSPFVQGIDTEKSGNKSGYRLCTPDMVSGHVDY